MIAKLRGGDCFLNQLIHVHTHADLAAYALAEFAGLQHLFDGRHQSVGVLAHHGQEFLLLLVRDFAAAHGVEIEPDGGDGRLQLVGYRVDEAVLLLVAADFAHQKNCVEDKSDDQKSEEGDADDERGETTPIEDDPAELQRDCDADQTDTERDGEKHRPTAPRNPHRLRKV